MMIASSIALCSALLPFKTIAASNQDFETKKYRDSIINNQTLISSRRPSIEVSLDNGMTLRYFRERGRGIITDSEGVEIKRYDGWRTGWTIITYLGRDMILFYDRSNGIGSIYKVDNQGNLSPLKDYQGWNRTWSQIDVDVESNRVTFRNKRGDVGNYYVDDYGSFHDDHEANEN